MHARPPILMAKTLGWFEELLPREAFVRIHRSALINLLHLHEYQHGQADLAIMRDGTALPIARRKKPAFKAHWQRWSLQNPNSGY